MILIKYQVIENLAKISSFKLSERIDLLDSKNVLKVILSSFVRFFLNSIFKQERKLLNGVLVLNQSCLVLHYNSPLI